MKLQGALERRPGGHRYYLAGRPVNGGDTVELCCSGGWIVGRYEWNHDEHVLPSFHFSIEIEGGGQAPCQIAIPEDALLRWP